MRTHLATAVLALALLGVTAGCGDDPDQTDPVAADPTPIASDTATSEPSSEPDPVDPAEPPFPANTKPDDGGYGEGGPRWVTGIRVARNDGFDRVVFDLDGGGAPGWYVTYTKNPQQDGSGDPVDVEGDMFLQVVLRGMGYPGFDGIPEIDLDDVPGDGTTTVTEVVPGGVFEGDMQSFIGLSGGKKPFRVFALSNPTRVVVDIRDN